MTLADIIERARQGRAMVVFSVPQGDGVHLVEPGAELDEELQRDLWRQPGCFHICGGEVIVSEAWTVTPTPDTPEAARLSQRLGLEVTAFVHRPPPRPRRRPAA